MRLAAIYIENHEYLFDKPQTLNFGGKYFYDFTKQGEDIIINRQQNETFIDNMFNLTQIKSCVTNLNAIVGQNGSGKSTLLDIIRSVFVEHQYALPQSTSIIIVEIDNIDSPRILRNNFNDVYLQQSVSKGSNLETELVKLSNFEIKKAQTIYYSPHYDYKYNQNFDNVDSHDISFDRIIEKDLAELNEKDTNENGWSYSPSQELLFKNSLRQIEFLSSDIVSRQNIFKDIFNLQDHYEPILFFRGYKIQEKDWNTPTAFRRALNSISKKLEDERNNWHTIRKFKNRKILNQVEVNQYLLKRYVIESVITLLYKQMERQNSFLDKGIFPYDKLETKLNELDAYDSFLLFIDNCSIKLTSGKTEKIFNKPYLKLLLSKIYESIEIADNEDSVTKTNLKTSKKNAVEILKLQRNFLNELNIYYYKFYSQIDEQIIPDSERIEEFINYMPFSRRLSSGENALLNLFSGIYSFLNDNLKQNRFRELRDHYILLLDEADLSFHPSWKKRYVKALLKTIPFFFNELENKPSIQIIFTTHDPLTLSDLPNSNVIYIERRSYEVEPNILDYNDNNRPLKTFGANISDLIADSFFVDNSLIGDFAFDLIQKTIIWLNEKKNKDNSEYYRKIIQIIDEPIIQRKLAEMFDDKMKSEFQLSIVNNQIKRLQILKNKLDQ